MDLEGQRDKTAAREKDRKTERGRKTESEKQNEFNFLKKFSCGLQNYFNFLYYK